MSGTPTPTPMTEAPVTTVRRGRSIAMVIALALVVVTIAFACVSVAASYWTQRNARLANLEAESGLIADQLAASLGRTVGTFNLEEIGHTLDAAMLHAQVYAVEVVLADRGATRQARVRDAAWLSRDAGVIADAPDLLRFERAIRSNGAVVGKLRMAVTPRFELAEVRQLLFYTIAIISGMTGLLGAALYFVLWRLVIQPLRELEAQAGAIRAGRQSRLGVGRGRHFVGEVERLRVSLDDMVELFNRRYEDVKQSEARVQALLRLSADWYWEQDEHFRFVRMGGPSSPLVRATGELYVGKTRWELPLLGVTDKQWAEHKAILEAHKPFRDFTHQFLDPRNGMRTLVTSGEPFFDADGRFLGYRGIGSDVTELASTVEALNRTEARMRAMSDNLPNGMVYQVVRELDGRVRFQYVSAGVERINGVSPQQVLEDPGLLYRQIDAEDREPFRVAEQASYDSMTPLTAVLRITRPDGARRWIHLSSAPRAMPDGRVLWDGFSIDVTETKLAEAELELSRARMAGIVDSAMDAIITVDEEQRIVVFNRAAERIMRCTAAEAIGQPLERFVPPRHRAAHQEHLRRFSETGTTSRGQGRVGELPGLRWDGEEFPMEASVSRTSLGGQRFFTVMLRDITARKREDSERRNLEARLRQSQKMEAIGTLAGGIAHDFNNMLAVISGNIELALRDIEPGSKASLRLAEIEKAGRRAKDLVRQILTFSRPQQVERNVVDLRLAVEESLQMLSAALPATVRMRPALAEDSPRVSADPTQIHQILANLCTNAWHAMEGRPGSISVRLDRLVADERGMVDGVELEPGVYARLVVADDGKGMTEATVARLFEPFFTTKPAGMGTGLGLPVVHGIVQSHGGRIGVKSEPGTGTQVTVFLPAVDATGAPEEVARDGMGELAAAQSGGEHVLFLDDEEAIVVVVTELLQYLGYRVTGFTVPADAVAALEAHPDAFDLAITDYNMPERSGVQVAADLRRVKPNLPIIVASGFLSDDITRSIEGAGLQAVLAKPVSGSELARTVRHVLTEAGGP